MIGDVYSKEASLEDSVIGCLRLCRPGQIDEVDKEWPGCHPEQEKTKYVQRSLCLTARRFSGGNCPGGLRKNLSGFLLVWYNIEMNSD